jgi:hypothetical protein
MKNANRNMSEILHAIKDVMLGKSNPDRLDELTGGSGEYWEHAIVAQVDRSRLCTDDPTGASVKPSCGEIVETTSEDSFPASDSPSWTPTTGVGPLR